MRITADLITKCVAYMDPLNNFHLDLRGYKIPFLENLTATNDQFGTIDLTDNEIVTLESLPQLLRLHTLLLANNRITKIDEEFSAMCPSLESLILTNNKLASLNEISKLAKSCGNSLVRLSLVGNLVSQAPHYRAFVIFKLPKLRVLDFQKVSQKERAAATKLFSSAAGQVILKEIASKGD